MCISAEASIKSFGVNLVSCIALLLLGNPKLKLFNIVTAIFAIFTSLMQLVDLGMWKDLDGKKGIHQIASYAGPILNYLQPVVLFMVAFYLLNFTSLGKKPEGKQFNFGKVGNSIAAQLDIKMKPGNPINFNKVINLVYLVIIIVILIRYYRDKWPQEKYKISKVENGHLKWRWYDESKSHMVFTITYLIVAGLTFIGIGPRTPYSYVLFLVYYVALTLVSILKKEHIGEIWCYVANSFPIILLALQTVLAKQLV